MKFTTKPRAVVTFCIATILSASSASALQTDGDAAEALTNLIDPPAAGTQQDQGPSLAVMEQVVRNLIGTASEESIAVFGESAGPALRAIVEEYSLDELMAKTDVSPLHYLTTSAPIAGLQYFSDLEQKSRFQYEALVRWKHPPLHLVGTAATEGVSRNLYLDLLDRTLSSGSLKLETRLKMAVGSLGEGVSTPLSRSLIEQNAELALRKHGKQDYYASPILDVVLPTQEAITANLPMRTALAALKYRANMDTFEALISSPHANVRGGVVNALQSQKSPGPLDRQLALLYQLSSDSDLIVAKRADESVFSFVNSDFVQLDIAAVTELIAKVGHKTTHGEHGNRALTRLVHNTAREFSSRNPAQVELLYRTVLGSPNSQIKRSDQGLRIEQSVAYFNATSEASAADREAALDSVVHALAQMPVDSPRRASGVLDTLLSDSMQPGKEVAFLSNAPSFGRETFVHTGRHPSGTVLSALPANRAGEALRWMADHSSQFGIMAFASPGSWRNAGSQMREAFAAEQSSTRLKLIAGAALVNSGAGNEADADAMTRLLVELCKVPSKSEDVEWFLKNKRSGPDTRAALHWNSITAAILQDNNVPDAIASGFALLSAPESAEKKALIRGVLEAAEQRAILSKGTATFDNLVFQGLSAMLADPTLFQPNLVRGWIMRKPGVSDDIISVVLTSGDDGLIEASMIHLLAGIASDGGSRKSVPMAIQLLRLPGDEPVQRLLEATLRSGNYSFVEAVEELVTERLRLREVALRWSNLGSGVTSIDSAKARVLKLLDSPNSEVRIEAIYGLGTLGVIEALPRLIEMVGSEHKGERDAAKETLKLLRDRSATTNAPVTHSNELPSPGTDE
ncbi:MAG: HEAT repeat domain-containing protein [bacterium]|nr:HEAT repeat domain-containing protein [bacterium]